MKNTLIICAAVLGLAGCGSSDIGSPPAADNEPVVDPGSPLAVGGGSGTNGGLDGAWTSLCDVHDDLTSEMVTITYSGRTALTEVIFYSDSNCQTISQMGSYTATLKFGNDVTVDGSIDGITSATEFDFELLTVSGEMPFSVGDKFYLIYAIKGNKFYFGNETAANDGSSPAKRPIQLANGPDFEFTKQ